MDAAEADLGAGELPEFLQFKACSDASNSSSGGAGGAGPLYLVSVEGREQGDDGTEATL